MTLTPFQIVLVVGVLGGLAGVIVFLFKTLVEAKDHRIAELVAERDYYRSAALIERELPLELHPAALPAGTTLAVAVQPKNGNGKNGKPSDETTRTRFAMYSLLIQAIISIVIIIGAFILIIAPTEPTANQVAYQLLSFTLGTWLGRGIDYATKR